MQRKRASSASAYRALARTADKEIDQSAKEMEKQNDQHPHNSVCVAELLISNRVDQHPDPKDRGRNDKQPDSQE